MKTLSNIFSSVRVTVLFSKWQWLIYREIPELLLWSFQFPFFFFFFFFLGPHPWHVEVPRLGSNWSCSHWPTPQLQQHQIQAASATYTTGHSNARSLTHWSRPGIKLTSSWVLVRYVSTEPHWELPLQFFTSFHCKLNCISKDKCFEIISKTYQIVLLKN